MLSPFCNLRDELEQRQLHRACRAAGGVTVLPCTAWTAKKTILQGESAICAICCRRLAQEALTDEMVGMAATLKSSTMALTGRLRERDALLDETDDALQRSLDSARRSRARARQIYKRCPLGCKPVP